MRGRGFQIIASFFLMLSFSYGAHPEIPERLFPLPMAETEKILSQWLFDSGFEVIRRDEEGSGVQLRGIKDKEMWELNLRPRSPLASGIAPRYVASGQPSQDRVAALWSFLEDYVKEGEKERMIPSEEVPFKVKSRRETIVCIKVNYGKEEIQFTGFAIDSKGRILSTAHDLRGVKEVTVILADGQAQKGSIMKMDLHRDLTLIDIRSRLNASVPLYKVRNSLRNGEKVFADGCPGYVRRFLQGTIDGPLRWVNNLPLYQTEMDIQPGSSGSPVFDGEGNLVAMVKGRYRGVSSTGFLIPLATMLDFLKEK